MIKRIPAISLMLILVLGFSSSSLGSVAFAQTDQATSDDRQRDQLREEELRRQQAEEELHKQQAEKRAEEKRQEVKDRLEEKRLELQEKAKDRRDQMRDAVQDRKDAIKDRVQEKRDQMRDNVQNRKDEIRSKILDKHTNLREKFEDKKDDIKIELKEKARDKLSLVKDRVQDKRIAIKDKIQDKRDDIREFRDSVKDRVTDQVKDRIGLEIRDKVRDYVKDRVTDRDHQEIQDKIRDKIHDMVEFRADLIKSKIREIGIDKFREIISDHKDQIRDEVRDRIDSVRDKVRSSTLIDQVEDDSYYGDIAEIPEEDTINYVLNFEGNAYSTVDKNNVKSISGDVNLELVRLGDNTATLRIIDGQIVVEDAATGELYNVHDITFGRSRAHINGGTLQVSINTVDTNGHPHTFIMLTEMDGVFPVDYGETVDIHGTKGKSHSGTEWILDFVGTLAVDDPVPITVFEDVEELSQVDEVVEESTDDCYDLTLADFYTDKELEGLTEDELTELEEDLLTDICSEVADEVGEEIIG